MQITMVVGRGEMALWGKVKIGRCRGRNNRRKGELKSISFRTLYDTNSLLSWIFYSPIMILCGILRFSINNTHFKYVGDK